MGFNCHGVWLYTCRWHLQATDDTQLMVYTLQQNFSWIGRIIDPDRLYNSISRVNQRVYLRHSSASRFMEILHDLSKSSQSMEMTAHRCTTLEGWVHARKGQMTKTIVSWNSLMVTYLITSQHVTEVRQSRQEVPIPI